MPPVNTRDALDTAARLEALGVEVRSAELHAEAKRLQDWHASGGNRAMRRAAARAGKLKGRK